MSIAPTKQSKSQVSESPVVTRKQDPTALRSKALHILNKSPEVDVKALVQRVMGKTDLFDSFDSTEFCSKIK